MDRQCGQYLNRRVLEPFRRPACDHLVPGPCEFRDVRRVEGDQGVARCIGEVESGQALDQDRCRDQPLVGDPAIDREQFQFRREALAIALFV